MVRESGRARRLILQVRPPDTVEVVVPKRTSPIEVERFVTLNRVWIEQAQEEIRRRYPKALRAMPKHIAMPGIDRIWEVRYHTHSVNRAQLRRHANALDVHLPDERIEAARTLLRRWLMDTARRELKPRLQTLSQETGLRYKKVQIRTQRTRWGSCSSAGTISLNAAALFLEEDLVRYLMLHELCHLRHLNHSRRYWQLLEQFCPGSRGLDRRLGEAWVCVPSWAMG